MKPNDGYCHLSGGGIYTEAENQVGELVTFFHLFNIISYSKAL